MKRIILMALILSLCLTILPVTATTEFDLPKEALLSSLFEADIPTLRRALELKLITCQELTAYYLQRIEEYNQPYNCFITLCDDALETARQRDQQLADGTAQGSLFGIPLVVKDNIDVEGIVTTNGLKLKNPTAATSNAAVVDALLEEGAVIIGKTNMSTEAQSSRDSISAVAGETKNAYSTYMASGGSSGGSAVSVSLNFAVAALGTDTNSSLRLPAALNGCVSLRPTFGLLPNSGIKKLNSTRDTPGAITRTVYDQAVMLDALTGGIHGYAESLDPDILQGLRIGVLQELSYPLSYGYRKEENVDSEVSAAFEAVLQELAQCGAEIVPVSMPNVFNLSDATMSTSNSAPKDKLCRKFQELLTENDLAAVIFPTYLSTPHRSGTDADGVRWNVWDQPFINNCAILAPSARLPEITVPMGVHSLGAGMAFEIVSELNSEQLLLDIAYAYTSRFPHRQIPTGAPDSYAASGTGTLADHIAAYELFLNPPPTTEAPTEAPTQPEKETPGSEPDHPLAPPEENDPSLTWIFLLVTALMLALVIALLPRKKRRKKRRRKKRPATV
jgi:Asp-tRNA(Asn)/Glu-tRNA(Gln) amidotransferase A subunit family amidase